MKPVIPWGSNRRNAEWRGVAPASRAAFFSTSAAKSVLSSMLGSHPHSSINRCVPLVSTGYLLMPAGLVRSIPGGMSGFFSGVSRSPSFLPCFLFHRLKGTAPR